MTEEEKRFKIQKIESYEKEISKENKESINKTFLFGLSAAAAFCAFYVDTITETSYNSQLIFLGLADAGFSAYHLIGLIESISRKTNLQSKIENINSELERLESRESKGMRR